MTPIKPSARDKPFSCQIFTLEKLFLHEPIQAVALPCVSGKLQILPNHAPFFLSLTQGVISLVLEKQTSPQNYSITKGMAQILAGNVRLVVPRITPC